MEENNESAEAEAFRKAIQRRIVAESDRLIDELFALAYDDEADARTRLSAINILLERSLPKVGVQHAKKEENEERASRKSVREEIEKMFKKREEEEDQ